MLWFDITLWVSPCQWKTLFEQNNLLHGWCILATGPQPAEKAMYEFDDALVNYSVNDDAKVTATLCKSLDAARSVAAGFTSASGGVSAGTAAGASAGASFGTDSASSEGTDRTSSASQKVTEWLFPRLTLWPQGSVRLSAEFKKDLEAALGFENPDMQMAGIQGSEPPSLSSPSPHSPGGLSGMSGGRSPGRNWVSNPTDTHRVDATVLVRATDLPVGDRTGNHTGARRSPETFTSP